MREGTWRGYEAPIARLGAYLETHEGAPSLETVSLSAVSRRIAGEVIADRRAERASETVQRDFSAWNGLWRWAVRRGYADLNPWTDQTAGLKARRADEDGETKRAYTPAELVKLLRAGGDLLSPQRGGYGPALWDLIRLGLLTRRPRKRVGGPMRWRRDRGRHRHCDGTTRQIRQRIPHHPVAPSCPERHQRPHRCIG